MTRNDVLSQVDGSFGGLARPALFIRGTCACDECLEHEQTMQSFSLPDLPLDRLGNPGWDPICFASDEEFAYLMPGLVRLVLNHTDAYLSQFLFHLDANDRLAGLSIGQQRALRHTLDYLFTNAVDALETHMAADDLIRVMEKLDQLA